MYSTPLVSLVSDQDNLRKGKKGSREWNGSPRDSERLPTASSRKCFAMQIEIKTQRITQEWKPCASNQSSSRGVVDRVFQKVVTKVEYAHLHS
jgi:hypothetical protein